MAESRVKKSLLNAKVNLIFYVLTLALAFFSRKIFLDCLGADFVGLTGTLMNLLGFLNLAELGVGAAIGYVLYKPLFEQDQTKINEIISVFGYLYRWIGFIIAALGIVLSCFLPLIFPNTGISMGVIFAAYFSFLVSSLIGYFCNYKQTLLGADQKNYVVTAYFQSAMIVKTLIQMGSAWYTGNYYLWVAIELAFGVVYSVILEWKIRQTYPWLNSRVKEGRKLLLQYRGIVVKIKQLMVHKFGAFGQHQTIPFITYAFASLEACAMLGNYTMIIDKVRILVSNFFSGTEAGVGNLIAEGNQHKIESVFWELYTARVVVAATVCFALWKLTEPFIVLWLGREYVMSQAVLLLLVAQTYISIERCTVLNFLFGYGLFWDVWAPFIEGVLCIVCAVIGGWLFGIEGVMLGSVISLILVVEIWKPFMLFRWGFARRIGEYCFKWFMYVGLALATMWVDHLLLPCLFPWPVTGYATWTLYACVVTLSFLLLYSALMFCLFSSMRVLVGRFLSRLRLG